MKNNYLTEMIVGKNYQCKLFGHRYVLTKKVNEHFSEFVCCNCQQQMTNDSTGHKIMLTTELKEINETLFYLHLRREFVSRFYFRKKN